MERAKLKHVLIDVNLPSHNKIKLLKLHHGVQGKCALYEIYCAMSKATDAIIEKDLILCIALENEVGDPEAFFKFCLEKHLIQLEMGGYSNQPVIEDQEQYYRKLQSGKKRKESAQQCSESEQKTTSLDNDFDIEDLDLKKNGQPSKPPPDGLIKISDHVRLTEISRDQFKIQLIAEGFTFKERKEVIDKLDRWFHKNPEKYKEEDHFRDLMDWPLREIRKAKAELERVRGSPKNGHKAEPLHPSRFKPIGF